MATLHRYKRATLLKYKKGAKTSNSGVERNVIRYKHLQSLRLRFKVRCVRGLLLRLHGSMSRAGQGATGAPELGAGPVCALRPSDIFLSVSSCFGRAGPVGRGAERDAGVP